jgi:hypothetical protein
MAVPKMRLPIVRRGGWSPDDTPPAAKSIDTLIIGGGLDPRGCISPRNRDNTFVLIIAFWFVEASAKTVANQKFLVLPGEKQTRASASGSHSIDARNPPSFDSYYKSTSFNASSKTQYGGFIY